jgi:hypothetical protein
MSWPPLPIPIPQAVSRTAAPRCTAPSTAASRPRSGKRIQKQCWGAATWTGRYACWVCSMGISGTDWFEVATIYKAYFLGLCKGIYPQNMAIVLLIFIRQIMVSVLSHDWPPCVTGEFFQHQNKWHLWFERAGRKLRGILIWHEVMCWGWLPHTVPI